MPSSDRNLWAESSAIIDQMIDLMLQGLKSWAINYYLFRLIIAVEIYWKMITVSWSKRGARHRNSWIHYDPKSFHMAAKIRLFAERNREKLWNWIWIFFLFLFQVSFWKNRWNSNQKKMFTFDRRIGLKSFLAWNSWNFGQILGMSKKSNTSDTSWIS